jgi:hypothetical protein
LITAAGSIIACGGGTSQQTNTVAPGTTQIMVTGTATAAPGTGNLNQSVSLTVIIQ